MYIFMFPSPLRVRLSGDDFSSPLSNVIGRCRFGGDCLFFSSAFSICFCCKRQSLLKYVKCMSSKMKYYKFLKVLTLTSFSGFWVVWKESCTLLLKLGGVRKMSRIRVLMFEVVFKATILSLFSSESSFFPWNIDTRLAKFI